MSDFFGQPLVRDPAVALPPLSLNLPARPGPLYTVQFVIELVGPRTVPATAAQGLLSPDWQSALGQPEIWAMTPADNQWRPLDQTNNASPTPTLQYSNTPILQGSLDSLALAWDLISPRGKLNSASAHHLFKVAEQFGQAIERRAMPIPPPQDVDGRVKALKEAQEALDIGFSLALANASGWMLERDIWIQCARLGLELGPDGVFGWKAPNWDEPIVSLTPLGEAAGFSLGAVQRGESHPGIGLGFSVPRSPSPADALNGAIHIARTLAATFEALILDEDGEPLTAASEATYRRNIIEADKTLRQAGLPPGSPEALKLFPG